MASSYDECVNSVDFTENLFKSLGFYINVNKSVTIPTQELEHLGPKTINVFRACLGAQLTICAQK